MDRNSVWRKRTGSQTFVSVVIATFAFSHASPQPPLAERDTPVDDDAGVCTLLAGSPFALDIARDGRRLFLLVQ